MAATDGFTASPQAGYDPLVGPGFNAEAVTPHDTNQLTNVSRGLYVGVGGDVTVLTAGGQTVLFKAVPAGTVLPIRINRVNSTGTTATNMVSIW